MPPQLSAEAASNGTPVRLRGALLEMVRHPVAFAEEWNWKAAAISAMLHAVLFLLTNLGAGHGRAVRAMLVEAVYATVTAGIAGAVTQRLRHAVPRGWTAFVVWVVLPVLMLVMRAVVHHAAGTPRLRSSMVATFVFAVVATGFNWFAMSRGAFVTGEGRSFRRDLLLLPKLVVQFVAELPKLLLGRES